METIEGKKVQFDKKTETCIYDPSHDGPDIPDDVVAVQGFGEASMLKCMRRRISEKFNIYTYVGDVVLVLNPYMYLPKMVDIAEPPAQKMYKLGSEPSVYATAHFAYVVVVVFEYFNKLIEIAHARTQLLRFERSR